MPSYQRYKGLIDVFNFLGGEKKRKSSQEKQKQLYRGMRLNKNLILVKSVTYSSNCV